MRAITVLKRTGLKALSRLTGRHAVLLPGDARDAALMPVRAPYRIEGPVLAVDLKTASAGTVSAQLLAYSGHFPRLKVGPAIETTYDGPSTFTLSLETGEVKLNGRRLATIPSFAPTRRFCWCFAHVDQCGTRTTYLTSHYVPEPKQHDAAYFQGRNYVDYEQESAASHLVIADLLHRFEASGPVLEIGCATGGLMSLLTARGYVVYGADVSEWAVRQAAIRLGPGRVWRCDIEHEPLPVELAACAPFSTVIMAAVFEHFADPFGVLARLTPFVAADARLVVTTTNASSLTRFLFGPDWEGHFDASHLGVDRVDVAALRSTLPSLGWRVALLETDRAWTASADPQHATVRDWYDADGRFRTLLRERELGDLITCVAIRE